MVPQVKEDLFTVAKVSAVWVLAKWGHLLDALGDVSAWFLSVSSTMASVLAIVYTSVSLWVLVRDKIVRHRIRQREAETTSDYTTL